jgi:hypothetical protein
MRQAKLNMNVRKHGVLLPVLGLLVMLLPARVLPATSFFPPELYGPSGRPSVWVLFVGLAVVGLGAICLAGAIASEETLKKNPSLRAEENPVTSRIACAVGAVVFFTMGGAFVLGWFKVL